MTAARAGNADAVKALIAHGANVNAKEKWQEQTALMWAAAENHPAAIKALAAAGADMNAHSRVLSFPEYKYETNGMGVFILPHGRWAPPTYAAPANGVDDAALAAGSKADLNGVGADGTATLPFAIIHPPYYSR